MARARSVVPKMESMPASVGLSLRSCVKMGRPHAYGDVKATRGATKANPALWQVKAAEDGRLIRPTAARLSGRAVEATREEAFSAWARIGAALAGSADAGDTTPGSGATSTASVAIAAYNVFTAYRRRPRNSGTAL